jgi:hypothetical protein
VLLGSEAWAEERGLPILAYLRDGEAAAVDFVNGAEGLLMAPVYAVPRLLARNGLTLQDFDYEIHEAFAAQVLCTLKAWEDADYCKTRLGLDAPLGSIDRSRLNVKGSSWPPGTVCRHRRAYRRQPRQVAGRGGQGAWADFDLCGRRPRCHRNHRTLIAAQTGILDAFLSGQRSLASPTGELIAV